MQSLSSSPFAIAGVLLVLLLACHEIGFQLGRRLDGVDEDYKRRVDMIRTAILALVTFLVGFSFAAAGSRYIDRQDMIVKGVASKSGNKIFIIQSIDRKMDFEDIARARDLDFDELLTEIEGIVNAGTKLDISYYLKTFMDEEKIEDIYLDLVSEESR